MHITTLAFLALMGLNLIQQTTSFVVHLRRPFKSLTQIRVVAPQRKVEEQLQLYNGDNSAVVPITEMITSAGKNLPTMVSMFFTEGNVQFFPFECIIDCSFSS